MHRQWVGGFIPLLVSFIRFLVCLLIYCVLWVSWILGIVMSGRRDIKNNTTCLFPQGPPTLWGEILEWMCRNPLRKVCQVQLCRLYTAQIQRASFYRQQCPWLPQPLCSTVALQRSKEEGDWIQPGRGRVCDIKCWWQNRKKAREFGKQIAMK